jgi:hypothetical protein
MNYLPNLKMYMVSSVESYQSLARLLLDQPPTSTSVNGKLSLCVSGRYSTEQLPGLEHAFQSNQSVKTLSLGGFMVDGIVIVLDLVLLLSKLEELTLEMGHRDDVQNAALLRGVASFVSSLSLPVAAQSSLQHLKINYGRFNGDSMPFWNALQHNNTLQKVTFTSTNFDNANATAFADCFNNSVKVLSMCGGDANDDGLIGLVTAGLPNFTTLRELSVNAHPTDPIAAMKALMAALKKNGSLHAVRFTYDMDGRRDLTFGKVFQDAICQRNQRVPELFREARKQDKKRPIEIVEERVSKKMVPTLSLAGIQSPRMAGTTLLAAFSSWDGIGN